MDTSRIKLLHTPSIGSGLQLCPVEINAQYREEWQTNWSLCCLTLDGELVSETLYSTPGPGRGLISKGDYYLLHKHVEAIYNDDVMKMAWKDDYKKHSPKHLEALYVIIDKNGQEKVQFKKYQTPHLIQNSCIYILDNSYYNIETNELYAHSYKHYLDSDGFVFIKMALNHYFHDANSNLERNNLTDIERDNYELQKEEALRILKDFENDII